MNHSPFLVSPGHKVRLKDYDPAYTGRFTRKEDAGKKLEEDIKELASLQDVLYAQNSYALLIIIQAMDAAGKDGIIKHVMSGVNPQGCQVTSFKSPSAEELEHDYLWRCVKALPERGRIGIFNRSYYEEVLVVRVHPEYLAAQRLPKSTQGNETWKLRFEQINDFERHLGENGIVTLKFFLHVSKKEQKRRFLERIDTPEKNWKFSPSDLAERAHWDEYMKAYEDVVNHTSSACAPWYIIPADHKWFTRLCVADIIVKCLRSLHLAYPVVSDDHRKALLKSKKTLESE
jgi:PPK2 family polyphosphate:nucleotide phosphotransferase